jgi:hypothetical protein
MLDQVKKEMKAECFIIEDHKNDYKKITNFEEISEKLDECLITLNNILGSRYVARIKADADK